MLRMGENVFCQWPWTKIKVSPDGTICNCCFQNPIGNILLQPLEEWWSGTVVKQIREAIRSGELESTRCHTYTCPYRDELRRENKQFIIPDFDPLQPVSIELDLPNTCCNIGGEQPTPQTACIMCPRATEPFRPDGARFDEVLERIRPLTPRLRELWVVGLAEAFWQDKLYDVLDRLNYFPYRETCMYQSFSNGILLNERTRTKFLQRIPFSHLVVSIDAASSGTYRKIRRLNAFDTVVKNIKDYVNDSRRTTRQTIGVTYNINMINVHEVEAMVQTWQGWPVSSVCFTSTYPTGSEELKQHLVGPHNAHLFIAARDKIYETAQRLGMTNVMIFNRLESHYGGS